METEKFILLRPRSTDQGWSLGVHSELFCSYLSYTWRGFKVLLVTSVMHKHVFKQEKTMWTSSVTVIFVIKVDVNIFVHNSLRRHQQGYIQRNFIAVHPW